MRLNKTMIAILGTALAAATGCQMCKVRQQEEPLVVRTFKLLPSPYICVEHCHNAGEDCFCMYHTPEEQDAAKSRQWKRNFEKFFVPWPCGSFVREENRTLTVCNTTNNLEEIARLIGLWHEDNQPKMISLELIIERKGKEIAAPKILMRNGEEEVYKSVTEYIYPTDFEIQSRGISDESLNITNMWSTVEPQEFMMREVGWIIDITPTLSDNEAFVDLNLRVSVVDEPTWKDYGYTLIATNGEKYSLPMEQPFFPVGSLETVNLSLAFGQATVIGGDDLRVTITPKRFPIRMDETAQRESGE